MTTPHRKKGATPSTVLSKLDRAPTLAHPNETVIRHDATHSSETLVTMDEQFVRMELKMRKKDWPALCYELCTASELKPLYLMYLALSMAGNDSASFTTKEMFLIDNALKDGSLMTLKKRAVALFSASKTIKKLLESSDNVHDTRI